MVLLQKKINSTVMAVTRGFTGDRIYTEDAGHKVERELRGEEREEPGRRVEAGADLVLLEVVVQVTVVVVQQPGELVHLNLCR